MELVFIITFGVLFLICLFLGMHEKSQPLVVFAIVLAVLLGGALISTGIQLNIGTNSTISDDNRTVSHTPITTSLPSLWTNALALIFFVLSIWLVIVIGISTRERED